MNRSLARVALPVVLGGLLLAGCGGEDTDASAVPSSPTVSTDADESSAPATTPSAAPSAAAPAAPPAPAGGGEVTEPEARAIALQAAGPGAQVSEFEEDTDDGRPTYKYKTVNGAEEREIKIERSTGAILKNEVDTDN